MKIAARKSVPVEHRALVDRTLQFGGNAMGEYKSRDREKGSSKEHRKLVKISMPGTSSH